MNDSNERSGIVTILGEVNVGKSSLLNVLVKKDISIITHKSNTTNKQIKGIRTHKKSQITFIDTPGLYFCKGKTNRNFLTDIWNAVSEADFLCVVLDISKNVSQNLIQFFEQIDLKNLPNKKSILVLNKIDLVEKEKLLIKAKEINDKLQFDKTFMISAKKKYGVEDLFLWLSKNITKKKWSYPSDKNSDQSFEDQINEKTREIILLRIHDEIPYNIEVNSDKILNFGRSKIRIFQSIFVENQRHRIILIGKKGETIKYISMNARKKIEMYTKKKVDLFLNVKIKKKQNKK